ncbi:hypothetical protein [uncultured Roseovarius sp.]|uniref:hypothetical protein n=1 Tax=uncultured Roseovarius sp. TaxID=293344 RepID=UPI002634BCC3|nr:hypothetical protein [uncultured Roseovarius sp.]
MTRILKFSLLSLVLGVSGAAQAFVVGTPSMPSGWPAGDTAPAPDTVTRDVVPG